MAGVKLAVEYACALQASLTCAEPYRHFAGTHSSVQTSKAPHLSSIKERSAICVPPSVPDVGSRNAVARLGLDGWVVAPWRNLLRTTRMQPLVGQANGRGWSMVGDTATLGRRARAAAVHSLRMSTDAVMCSSSSTGAQKTKSVFTHCTTTSSTTASQNL
eukprot:982523-Rhodomonas_salina.1